MFQSLRRQRRHRRWQQHSSYCNRTSSLEQVRAPQTMLWGSLPWTLRHQRQPPPPTVLPPHNILSQPSLQYPGMLQVRTPSCLLPVCHQVCVCVCVCGRVLFSFLWVTSSIIHSLITFEFGSYITACNALCCPVGCVTPASLISILILCVRARDLLYSYKAIVVMFQPKLLSCPQHLAHQQATWLPRVRHCWWPQPQELPLPQAMLHWWPLQLCRSVFIKLTISHPHTCFSIYYYLLICIFCPLLCYGF